MFKYLEKFIYVFSGNRKNLILVTCLFTVSSLFETIGIGLISPFLSIASNPDNIDRIFGLGWLRNQFIWASAQQFILILGILLISIFLLKSIFYFFSKVFILRFSFMQRQMLQVRLLKSYINAPYEFYLNYNSSDLINKISVETAQFTNICVIPLLETISSTIITLSLLGLLANTNPVLLLMIACTIGAIVLLFIKLGGKIKKWGENATISRKEQIKILNHSIGGLKELKIIGCEHYFEQQMDEASQRVTNSEILFQSSQFAPRILIENSLMMFFIGFFSISQLFSTQEFDDVVSIMGVFAIAGIRLIPASSTLIQSIGKLKNSSYILDTIYLGLTEIENKYCDDIIENIRIKNGVNERFSEIAFKNKLEVKNICYQYPVAKENAVTDISFTIEKGQSIAFIGKSGSGKTTLVDIFLTLLRPQKGDIQVDGTSIYTALPEWRKLIGYIPQSIFLMDDTIERNIAFGVPDHEISVSRLAQAIRSAQLEELILQLPEGMQTNVGERGVRLSGGQRQRIGIARALYHEREILVLDEATSALDQETEQLVSEAISALSGNKTLIIIAHRLSTIEKCDRIFQLEHGEIIKSGIYHDVVMSHHPDMS
jgi:ATP-binding cassette, subfamily B, bacterial PglK